MKLHIPSGMQGVAEAGQVILSQTERRLEMTSHNVANVSTPGFKRQVSFADMVLPSNSASQNADAVQQRVNQQADMTQGKFKQTRNPLDIAISGTGLFQVRASESYFYTRQGQFKLTDDGTLVNSQGFVLQGDGGDIILADPSAEILENGTVLEDGLPTSRIAVFTAKDNSELVSVSGSLFAARDRELETMETPVLRQGYVESSNVTMTDEMVSMMAAVRQAETGSRLIQVYDDLMGRALSTFGQGAR